MERAWVNELRVVHTLQEIDPIFLGMYGKPIRFSSNLPKKIRNVQPGDSIASGRQRRRIIRNWKLMIALSSCHVLDHLARELAALDLLRALHQPGEVVGDGLGADRLLQALDDQVGGFLPAHVLEHHHAGEDHAAGVDVVLVGVLGGGAVGGFEDGVAGDVVDVAAGGDADAADLRGQGVAEIIAVEIRAWR